MSDSCAPSAGQIRGLWSCASHIQIKPCCNLNLFLLFSLCRSVWRWRTGNMWRSLRRMPGKLNTWMLFTSCGRCCPVKLFTSLQCPPRWATYFTLSIDTEISRSLALSWQQDEGKSITVCLNPQLPQVESNGQVVEFSLWRYIFTLFFLCFFLLLLRSICLSI